MNFQSIFYNEHFYRKLSISVVLLRLLPSNFSAKEFAREIQKEIVKKRRDEKFQIDRSSSKFSRRTKNFHRPIEIVEVHGNFLEQLEHFPLTNDIEVQSIVVDTIRQIFQIIQRNFDDFLHEKNRDFTEKILRLILNFDSLPNVRQFSFSNLTNFIDRLFQNLNNETNRSLIQFIDILDGMNDVKVRQQTTGTSSKPDFDASDEDSWLFDEMTREESIKSLENQINGTFLVRPSSTIKGDLVLCVREAPKVSHYIINVSQENSNLIYRIGDKTFPSMKDLLTFYKQRLLDTSTLVQILPKPRVRTKFPFAGKDDEDLPFRKGEILTIIRKVEPLWWLARNSEGKQGVIPANYIESIWFVLWFLCTLKTMNLLFSFRFF